MKAKVTYVPAWWVFDSITGTLYAEGREVYKWSSLNNLLKSSVRKPIFFSLRCRLLPSGKKGTVLAEPLTGQIPFLLKEEREITEKNSVAIQSYTLRCDNKDPKFTRDLYLALSSFQYFKDWSDDDSSPTIIGKDESGAPRVLLLGRDKDYNAVKDYLRVIIPLADGNGAAVTEGGATVYLKGTPLDMEVMLIDFLPKHTPNIIPFPKEKSAIFIQ